MGKAEEFIKLVCIKLVLPVADVKSRRRYRKLCEARQVISYILLLFTDMTLRTIADELNYKSHASPWRDKKQVSNFLEIDKHFAAKYQPIILSAKNLNERLDKNYQKEILGNSPELGDVCWFWNDSHGLPLIGTFELSYLNEDNEQRFVDREFFAGYSHCIYAGEKILPEIFRGSINIDPAFQNTKSYLPAVITA